MSLLDAVPCHGVVVRLQLPFVVEILESLHVAERTAGYLAQALRRDGSSRCQKLDGGGQGTHHVAKTKDSNQIVLGT